MVENRTGDASMKRTLLLHVGGVAADVARGFAAASRLVDAGVRADVQVVVNGAAIEGLKSVRSADIPESVLVKACAVALRSHHMEASQLAEGIDVVDSGVVYLATCELSGAKYIHI